MGEIFISIIGEWLIFGVWAIISGIYDWIKGILIGVPKKVVEKKRLEKKWLYKKVSLKKKQENGLEIGLSGTVMEIIDKTTAFVEFYDKEGEFIEIKNELMFKIKLRNLKLKK